MTETLRTANGRHVLRLERRLPHPPEKVWRAVTEPEHLRHWFPSSVELDPRTGGRITFTFDTGGADPAPAGTGVVRHWEPPRVFAFTWEDEHFRIELHPDGPGCRLVFEHTFDTRSAAASYGAGWDICLGALELALAGRTAATAEAPSAALHERYVHAFGLDQGTAEVGPDGWQVHFDRQLTRPAAQVWAALVQADPDAAAPVIGGPVPPGCALARFPAGPVTELRARRLLGYEWRAGGRPAGRIRWELREGTGHGARLLLTQTGSADTAREREEALTAWRARIEELAGVLAAAADRR